MVAHQTSQYRGGSTPRSDETGDRRAETGKFNNGPKPEPKETGNRIWKLVHSYKVGDTFANTTAVAQIPGGCLVRTCSRNARGCAEALVYVPGAKLADFLAGGAR